MKKPLLCAHRGFSGRYPENSPIAFQAALEKTASENVVFSVVFNFRGYDTLGESFILIAGVAGCLVILRKSKGHGEEGDHA